MKKILMRIAYVLCIIVLLSACSSAKKESQQNTSRKADTKNEEVKREQTKKEETKQKETKEDAGNVTVIYNDSADTAKSELKVNGMHRENEMNTEEYAHIDENIYKSVLDDPLSTFSIDVDTASYSNVRRFLMDGKMPPKDAVRIEEMINYFSYDYQSPKGDDPFSVIHEIGKCPWNENHYLAMLSLKAKEMDDEQRPASNLVFLIDVSGSMNAENKLPLLKSSYKMLVNQLSEDDKVSIVVYAGAAGLVLPPTSGGNKDIIIDAIENLQAGGSTAGGEGINLAYKVAKEHFVKDGNNRIILATDGDFNVGPSSDGELTRLIEKNRKGGVFLSVMTFGTGNIKDSKAELLADKGNGNYAYIDNILEAKKVLVDQIGSTLFTVAKDVKFQVEFNPSKIKAYRLIGYENRVLNNEDFNDDKKDAGEVGAGHTVTAFYELIPADSDEEIPGVDELKYQTTTTKNSDELMFVKLRYKEPDEDVSKLIEIPITLDGLKNPSNNFYFASTVAEFGLLLRDSEYKGNASYDQVIEVAKSYKGKDDDGYRTEFIKMAELARALD